MKTVYCDWNVIEDKQWTKPMCEPQFYSVLADFGWQVIEEREGDADISLRLSYLIGQSPISHPKTLVFVKADTSWVAGGDAILDDDDRVVGFVVPFLASDPSRSTCQDICPPCKETIEKPVVALTAMLWQLLPVLPWYQNPLQKPCWDVSFIGTMHHGGTKFVQEHRAKLRSAWSQLDEFETVAMFSSNVKHGYVVNWEQAWRVTLRSRVVVSPWGMCEISWRDYEAAIAGAVIVKPRQPYMHVSDPSPWRDENVVYCEPDYSDLRDRVAEAMDVPYPPRLAIREEMLSKGMDLSVLARHFSEMLNGFV